MNEQGEDGYSHHFDGGGCGCTIYEHRPVPCSASDCRNDERIWPDFENMVPNPAVYRPDWEEMIQQQARDKRSTEDG